MKTMGFKIPRMSDGTIDIGFIENMKSEQFKSWIANRLKGNDPHYPFYSERELPIRIFRIVFKRASDSAFRNEFHLALRDLLTEIEDYSWSEMPEAEIRYANNLITLVGAFYAAYNINTSPINVNNNVHNEIEDTLYRLCKFNESLATHQTAYLNALYMLSRVEINNRVAFWEDIFEFKDGLFSPAAFGAIAKDDPFRAAVDFLPALVAAHLRHNENVNIDQQIHRLVTGNRHREQDLAIWITIGFEQYPDTEEKRVIGNILRSKFKLVGMSVLEHDEDIPEEYFTQEITQYRSRILQVTGGLQAAA